jgi:CheY-like chemotaxis protein
MAEILVIDDDEVILECLQIFLKQDGHSVITSREGMAGLSLLRNNPIDLVIVDIFMPEMDGLEVINHVQIEFPSIPILAISGGSAMLKSNSFLKVARQMGAFATLAKPIKRKKIRSVVSSLLP